MGPESVVPRAPYDRDPGGRRAGVARCGLPIHYPRNEPARTGRASDLRRDIRRPLAAQNRLFTPAPTHVLHRVLYSPRPCGSNLLGGNSPEAVSCS